MPVIIDDCVENTISTEPTVIANFQFGSTIDGLTLETYTTNMCIEYAEFMQMMYSRTGELIFRPSPVQSRNFLLREYESRHCSNYVPTYIVAAEPMPLTTTDLLASSDLHNLVNGPFTVIINVTIISAILHFGIKNKIVFTVASAPYHPALNICNSHIYRVIGPGDGNDTGNCNC